MYNDIAVAILAKGALHTTCSASGGGAEVPCHSRACAFMKVSVLICGLAFLWSGFSHKSEVANVMSTSSWDTFLPLVDVEETDKEVLAAAENFLKDANLPTPSSAYEISLHNLERHPAFPESKPPWPEPSGRSSQK